MDVSGLRVLVAAHREAERERKRLVLANASDPVRRLLEITRLTELLPAEEA